MNSQEKKTAAERERLRDEKKEQVLHLALDTDGNRAMMEGFLIYSIDRASKTADKLSRRIFWLNLIILIIGTLSLIVAGYSIFFK